MSDDTTNQENAVSRIRELFLSLTDSQKEEFIDELLQSEEFMGRLLNALMESERSVRGSGEGEPGFTDFLRKVRGK